MSYHFGFMIESMVAVLLLLTILYCVRLNSQLRLLKADEQSLRATISELVTATEIAERAIAGLKSTMHDTEASLGQQLADAERLSDELARERGASEELLGRLTRITGAGRLVEENVPDARAVAAAATAFAERAKARVNGQATVHAAATAKGTGLAA
ncbi:MAG: chemotaxis protein [Pseudolabrys sp.]|nr:chemotaxis protein [Pseudolabrys sp.]MBV9261347.1 chemotaxis protein [Pseudolabrys sp.]